MRMHVLVLLPLAFIVSACSSESDVVVMPQGAYGLGLHSAYVQEKFDRMVTNDSESVLLNFPAESIEGDVTKVQRANLEIHLVSSAGTGSLCKQYSLTRYSKKNVMEVGVVCKSKTLTNEQWIDVDTWNALPRETITPSQ